MSENNETKAGFNVLSALIMAVSNIEEKGFRLVISNTGDSPEIASLASYLKVTEQQAVLFVAVYHTQNSSFGAISVRQVARQHDLTFVEIMQYKSDIKQLYDEKLILVETEFTRRRRTNALYQQDILVNEDVLACIIDNKPISMANAELDVYQFVYEVSDMLYKRKNAALTTQQLFRAVEKLEEANMELPMVKELIHISVEVDDRTFFYEICNELVIENQPVNLEKTYSDMYDNTRVRFQKSRLALDKALSLFRHNYIQLMQGSFYSDMRIGLTDSGCELFMGEDAQLFVKKKKKKNRISPEDIQAKVLFFEPAFASQVDFIKASLANDKFVSLQERLKEKAFPTGVSCLFYGDPGTGKTETAMQIARATGREVFHVDISESKSAWFGESEKRIKEIFENYRRVSEKCEVKPILLFNEADAIFSKRKDVGAGNCAQTENAIQNIILEEMEKLDGILIATTNLTNNFDSAFDRRFLFKLRFTKPTPAERLKIWIEKMPWIEIDLAAELSRKFDFSGGEIDNIVRKTITEEVLSGEKPSYEKLTAFCESERISNKRQVCKLGF
jgi:AAA+ superfamily predicted ATPase